MNVDEIMALADDYASMAQFSATWQIEERRNDTAKTRAALRAAVERVIAERDELKIGPYIGIAYYQAEVEHAERAEAERDALRALLDTASDWVPVDSALRARIDAAIQEPPKSPARPPSASA